jgi:hypothetical protein
MRNLLIVLALPAILLAGGCRFWNNGEFGGSGGSDVSDQR